MGVSHAGGYNEKTMQLDSESRRKPYVRPILTRLTLEQAERLLKGSAVSDHLHVKDPYACECAQSREDTV